MSNGQKIECKYISIWEGGRMIETAAVLDIEIWEIDADYTTEDISDLEMLIGEELVINDKSFSISLDYDEIKEEYREDIYIFIQKLDKDNEEFNNRQKQQSLFNS